MLRWIKKRKPEVIIISDDEDEDAFQTSDSVPSKEVMVQKNNKLPTSRPLCFKTFKNSDASADIERMEVPPRKKLKGKAPMGKSGEHACRYSDSQVLDDIPALSPSRLSHPNYGLITNNESEDDSQKTIDNEILTPQQPPLDVLHIEPDEGIPTTRSTLYDFMKIIGGWDTPVDDENPVCKMIFPHQTTSAPKACKLPQGIIANILAYVTDPHDLYQCIQVDYPFFCASGPRLWETVDVRDALCRSRFISTLQDESILDPAYGHFIRHIQSPEVPFSDADVVSLSKQAPFLKTLVIPRSQLSNMTVRTLASHCVGLEHLDLRSTVMKHESVVALGKCCRQLTKLYVTCTNAYYLRPDAFSTLIGCPLTHLSVTFGSRQLLDTKRPSLDLAALFRLRSLHLSHVPPPIMHRLLVIKTKTPWKALTHLHLQQDQPMEYNGTTEEASDKGYTGFRRGYGLMWWDAGLVPFLRAHHHEQLQVLTLDGGRYTDAALDVFRGPKSKLKELHVANNQHITYDGIRRLIKRCPQLEAVTIRHCVYIMQCHFPEADPEFEFSLDMDIDLTTKAVLDRVRLAQLDETDHDTDTHYDYSDDDDDDDDDDE
ncbi:unnamed protein product [Absidia cylindrospora]